jgi:hypothetical protein
MAQTLTEEQCTVLASYLQIFESVHKDFRAAELSGDDEKIIEKIYNQWRGTVVNIRSCDECVNEAFDRLMNEYTQHEKAKHETGKN